MAELIDDIVKDIIASDESLANDEAALRQVILTMQKGKPNLKIDDSFKAKLKSDLISKLETRKSVASPFPRWVIYGTPLGVTLLLFMLIKPNEISLTPTSLDESRDVSPMMYSVPEGGIESRMMKDATVGSEEAFSDALPSANIDAFGITVSEDGLNLWVSYAEVSQPAFVVVKDGSGEVVAVSDILMPGIITETAVQTLIPLDKGTVYQAYLYYDNGDLEFSFDLDTNLLTLDSGQPLIIPVIP